MLLVILPGHIDLSAGSGVGLIGGIAAVLASGGEVPVRLIQGLRSGSTSLFGPSAAEWIPAPPWPAGWAMLLALGLALLLWSLMGTLIVRERIPAFIITLGGLLLFKGLFWLVIQSHTIPIAPPASGGAGVTTNWLQLGSWGVPVWEMTRSASGTLDVALCWGAHRLPVLSGTGNLYSMLTTSYLAPLAGYVLAGFVVSILTIGVWHGRRQRRAFSLPVEEGEVSFYRVFIATQALFLLVIIANQFRGVPLPAVLLGVVASGVWLITTRTTFGRYLYAIGGNEEAAIVSGVPVQRVVIMAFTIMGGIVALTGFLQTAYQGASTTTVGELMELDAVAACVIGGVSLKGGRGHVMGVLFGALIMATLINGMTLLTVEPPQKFMARGLVLILAVWMDVRLGK